MLVKQIQQLANDEVRDLWHELAAPAPETLTPEQKAGILEHFFKANWDNMIKPFPRYWALLQKRGLNAAKVNLEHAAAQFHRPGVSRFAGVVQPDVVRLRGRAAVSRDRGT